MEASPLEKAVGLSYPLEHLQEVKHRIVRMPREEQARYADAICRSISGNVAELEAMFEDLDPAHMDYASWNATSVGNTAYILLYSPLTRELKAKLEGLLDGYGKYVSSQGRSRTCNVA
jgi:hypothetical protein